VCSTQPPKALTSNASSATLAPREISVVHGMNKKSKARHWAHPFHTPPFLVDAGKLEAGL
jgi:hypothetical protein